MNTGTTNAWGPDNFLPHGRVFAVSSPAGAQANSAPHSHHLTRSLFQPAACFHALSKYIIIFEASIPSVKLNGNLPTSSKVADRFYPQNLAEESLFTFSQLHFATVLSVLHKLLMANLSHAQCWGYF